MTLLVNCMRLVHVSATRHFETNALFLFFPFVSLGLKACQEQETLYSCNWNESTQNTVHFDRTDLKFLVRKHTTLDCSIWLSVIKNHYFQFKKYKQRKTSDLSKHNHAFMSLLGLVSNLFSAFYLHDVSEFIFNRFSVDSEHRMLACS